MIMRIVKYLPFLITVFFVAVILSCDDTLTGEFHENQPPRTFLTVDTIATEQRMPSQVDIEWWGDDPDGYVAAYEICIDDQNIDMECDPSADNEWWERTERTDTTLILPLPVGESEADIRFSVRAIDNEGLRDPEGASVFFPIRNQPPSIMFDPTQSPPDTTYFMASFGFIAEDPDGEQDLNYYKIAINDTSWVRIDDPDIDFFSIEIDQNDVNADGSVTAELFTGRAFTPTGIKFESINLEEQNSVYLKAFDQAEEESPTDTLDLYIKEQKSNTLVVNDAAGTNIINQHADFLNYAGFGDFDYYDISEALIPSGNVLPIPIEPTLNRELAQWDNIYWVSNSLTRNLLFVLQATRDFRENNGKIFINAPITYDTDTPVDEENIDDVFSLIPASGFETHPDGGRFRLDRLGGEGREVLPVFQNSENGQDLTLQLDVGIGNLVPLIIGADNEPLFEADYIDSDDYDYSRVISSVEEGDDPSVLYFGIRLTDFTDDSPVHETVDYFLNERLGF